MNKENLLPVGKVVGVHGIRGEVKVLPYSEYEEDMWRAVSIFPGEGDSPYKVLHIRPHKGVVLIQLDGIATRDEAAALVGREVFTGKEQLPTLPEGEYYWYELTGMEVETEEGKHLGRIEKVFATGSNDVLEVDGPLGEVLIPVIKDVIVKVDRERKRVTVHLLDGLLP